MRASETSPHVLPLCTRVVVVADADGALLLCWSRHGLRHADCHLAVELPHQLAAGAEKTAQARRGQGAVGGGQGCRRHRRRIRAWSSLPAQPSTPKPRMSQPRSASPARTPHPSHMLPVSSMFSRTRSSSASRLPPGLRPRARHWMRRSLSNSGCGARRKSEQRGKLDSAGPAFTGAARQVQAISDAAPPSRHLP